MPESSKGKGSISLSSGKRQYLVGDDKVVLSLYLAAASKPRGVCDRQKSAVCARRTCGGGLLELCFPVGAKHWQKQCDPSAILSALCYKLPLFQADVCSVAALRGHALAACHVHQTAVAGRGSNLEMAPVCPRLAEHWESYVQKGGRCFSSPSIPAVPERFGWGL